MKYLIIIITSFLTTSVYAVNSVVGPTFSSNFIYLENVPNNNQKLIFSLKKGCQSDGEPMQVKEFYSQKEYGNVDSGKSEPVRIVNVYVQSNANGCQKFSKQKITKTLEIPSAKYMTHVYITTDSNVSVQSVQ